MPKDAAIGTAEVEISFDDWFEGGVQPARLLVNVSEFDVDRITVGIKSQVWGNFFQLFPHNEQVKKP